MIFLPCEGTTRQPSANQKMTPTSNWPHQRRDLGSHSPVRTVRELWEVSVHYLSLPAYGILFYYGILL